MSGPCADRPSRLIRQIVVAIAAFVAAHVPGAGLRVLLLLLGALSLVGASWGNSADLVKQLLSQLILLGVVGLAVRYVMRFNILGCFLVVVGTSLLGGASELLSQPDAFYRANGFVVLFALVLLFAWPFFVWRMHGPATAARAEGSSA